MRNTYVIQNVLTMSFFYVTMRANLKSGTVVCLEKKQNIYSVGLIPKTKN